jgi:hypothetical protein
VKLLLFYAILYPVELHVHGFGFALAYLIVGKSIRGGIVYLYRDGGGCGCPISASVILSGTPSLALLKSAPHSASAAEDMTLRMMVDVTSRGPFPTSGLVVAMSPR